MKNIFKATLAVAAVATVGMGSYKAYGSYVATNKVIDDALLAENIMAMSNNDNGGVNIDFCWQSSSTGYAASRTVCASGTSNVGGSGYPMGTIYPCSGNKICGSLLSSMGYCYTNAN